MVLSKEEEVKRVAAKFSGKITEQQLLEKWESWILENPYWSWEHFRLTVTEPLEGSWTRVSRQAWEVAKKAADRVVEEKKKDLKKLPAEELERILVGFAKGSEQMEFGKKLASLSEVRPPYVNLSGRAMKYASSYRRSLENYLERLVKGGVVLVKRHKPLRYGVLGICEEGLGFIVEVPR